jgi:hypothetical protein
MALGGANVAGIDLNGMEAQQQAWVFAQYEMHP